MITNILKKFLAALVLLMAAHTATSQTDPTTLYVIKNQTIIYQKSLTEIDSITFYEPQFAILPTSTTDPGVVINGVKWATRNVDAVGTFAATPESFGMFYQWNRNAAWLATGDVSNWDATTPAGTTWEAANDPSPSGWRVPTDAEFQSLLNTTYVTNEWTTQNGVTGRKFTDKASGSMLFFPAVGIRYHYDGTLGSQDTHGYYWSSTQYGGGNAYYLVFDSEDAFRNDGFLYFGFSVRCVAE